MNHVDFTGYISNNKSSLLTNENVKLYIFMHVRVVSHQYTSSVSFCSCKKKMNHGFHKNIKQYNCFHH